MSRHEDPVSPTHKVLDYRFISTLVDMSLFGFLRDNTMLRPIGWSSWSYHLIKHLLLPVYIQGQSRGW